MGNITDISQLNAVKLIVKYWVSAKIDPHSISFVGDVHGDLHQFLAPLVMNGVIRLSGNVNLVNADNIISGSSFNNDCLVPLPEYELLTESDSIVIFLGDICDEWILSRTIALMLLDLLRRAPNRVKFIYGNHDVAIIGRYNLFKKGCLDICHDIPALWETLKKELACEKNVKVYRDEILVDGDVEKGKQFVHLYIEPLFSAMHAIWNERLGKLSLALCGIGQDEGKHYMISHTTWTWAALKELISDTYNIPERCRPNDHNPIQAERISPKHVVSKESITYVNECMSNSFKDINYKLLSEACNDIWYGKTNGYISKNMITYTCNTNKVLLNHIIGHVPGGSRREIGVNTGNSMFYNERVKKLIPEILNDKEVYYFDFGASAGYDHDEISRPDFAYIRCDADSSKCIFAITNLPAFSFALTDVSKDDSPECWKDTLMIFPDKTVRSKLRSSLPSSDA